MRSGDGTDPSVGVTKLIYTEDPRMQEEGLAPYYMALKGERVGKLKLTTPLLPPPLPTTLLPLPPPTTPPLRRSCGQRTPTELPLTWTFKLYSYL